MTKVKKRLLIFLVFLLVSPLCPLFSQSRASEVSYTDIFLQGNVREIDLIRQKAIFYNIGISIWMGKSNYTVYVQIAGFGFSTMANNILSDGSYTYQHDWSNVPACELDLRPSSANLLFPGASSSYVFPYDKYFFTILIGSVEQIYAHNGILDEPRFHVTEPMRYTWNLTSSARVIGVDEAKGLVLSPFTLELHPELKYFALYSVEFQRINFHRPVFYYCYPTALVLLLLVATLILTVRRIVTPQNALIVATGVIFFIASFNILTEGILPPTRTLLEDVQILDLTLAFLLSGIALWMGRPARIHGPTTSHSSG